MDEKETYLCVVSYLEMNGCSMQVIPVYCRIFSLKQNECYIVVCHALW